jgi:hypothetical protein
LSPRMQDLPDGNRQPGNDRKALALFSSPSHHVK